MPGESDGSSQQAEKGDNSPVSLGARALGRDTEYPTWAWAGAGAPQDPLSAGRRALTAL